jgi:mannose-6-phosphate isomerase-like protein (cupin superfamily)
MDHNSITSQAISPIPADNPRRKLTVARANQGKGLPHLGVVGDTYTILLSGHDTNGRYCLIDMLVPPGGGPPPHRHDFEESFTILEGEIQATFRGRQSVVRAGETINIPANAPHYFTNAAKEPVRLLCICSPAGQEELFVAVGVPVATRTSPPPQPDQAAAAKLGAKVAALLPKFRTEMVKPRAQAQIASPRSTSPRRRRDSPGRRNSPGR